MKPYDGIRSRLSMGQRGFRGDIVHLGRDLDLNLGPLFLLTFEDGGGVPGEILDLVDGRVTTAARDPGRCGDL